jgi:glycosyltransferase involved in cell wall biosynthesis
MTAARGRRSRIGAAWPILTMRQRFDRIFGVRVLILLTGLKMGGAERNVVALMPRLRDLGAEVTLCTLSTARDGSLVEEFAALRIERVDLAAARLVDLAAHRRLVALLRQGRFELMHAQDQYAVLAGAAARLWTGTPFVMTRHVMTEPADTWRRSMRARLVFAAARYGIDAVIAVSDAVRQQFAVQSGLAASRIDTIHNGIELAKYDLSRREAIRARLGWAPDQPVVIMVAVMRPGKGHDLLLEAAAPLRQSVPGARIVLVGSGRLETSLRGAAASLGVEFIGERADVADLLAASDVLVLPSDNEGLPTVLIEAGAASLPVVATRVGGVPEIVEDGRTGHLIGRGDAAGLARCIVRLVKDQEAAREMGRVARRRIEERFSIEAQASRTIDLYRRVIATR